MLNFALLYRNLEAYQTSFNYLFNLNEIASSFEATINPDLLHTLIKCKSFYGLFFLQFNKHEEALKQLDHALILSQKELTLRMNMNIYMKDIKRKHRMNFLTCIRTMIRILYSMCLCYAHQKNYAKLFEALRLAIIFSEKYLQRIDAKQMIKLYAQIYENVN